MINTTIFSPKPLYFIVPGDLVAKDIYAGMVYSITDMVLMLWLLGITLYLMKKEFQKIKPKKKKQDINPILYGLVVSLSIIGLVFLVQTIFNKKWI